MPAVKLFKSSSKKLSTAKVMLTSVLAIVTPSVGMLTTTAHADDSIKQQIYRDASFGQVVRQLKANLQRDGYQVMRVKADDHKNKPTLEVYAKKQQYAYEQTYSYPDLTLIKSEQKPWSQLWQDDNQHDLEDKIKQSVYQDKDFAKVKRKAINKLTNMGYTVEDIEIDDYRQKAIFEVEATKNAQDYDIKLSYPDLDIIEIEED